MVALNRVKWSIINIKAFNFKLIKLFEAKQVEGLGTIIFTSHGKDLNWNNVVIFLKIIARYLRNMFSEYKKVIINRF